MEKKAVTPEEIAKRISAISEVEPDALDLAMLAEAKKINDGTTVNYGNYKKAKEYSGKMFLRVPKELHEELAKSAAANGVSLNQYALYKLSR